MSNKNSVLVNTIKDGFITKNPLLVSMLGVCPALATSTSVDNGLAMGIVVLAVLILSNVTVSLLKSMIPSKIRLAVYMIIIAGYVSATEMLFKAYLPSLDKSLGFYISLVVVNCVVLSRSEQFASKNSVVLSFVDALANGLGYTVVLVVISFIREVFGKGSIFGFDFAQYIGYSPISILAAPAGGFLVLGLLCALYNKIGLTRREKND